MVKNLRFRAFWIFPGILLIAIAVAVISYSTTKKQLPRETPPALISQHVSFSDFKNFQENEKCLQCHGQSKYSFENPTTKRRIYKKMYSELIIDRSLFYQSNHKKFKCIDCHSEDYGTFPHPGSLRMEVQPNCMDCHGGDPVYAKFHFENIQKEFQESVHSEKHSDDFTCWMCHNPHTYRLMARTNENIKLTIAYDNSICLSCHGDKNRYQLLTDKAQPNLIKKHDWLPNQALHFRSVRCIECHTQKINDSTLVAHKILPKKDAVKTCNECHSTSSVLMASLYKYKIREVRSARGFFTGTLVNDSYVIGANRNYILNLLSLLIAGAVVLGIAIHAVLRKFKKKS